MTERTTMHADANLKRSIALAISQSETVFDFYVKRRRASMDHAWERNNALMINAALDLRELISQIPREQLTPGLLKTLHGEMSIYNIIQAVVLSGFTNNEVFRARTQEVVMGRNKVDRDG